VELGDGQVSDRPTSMPADTLITALTRPPLPAAWTVSPQWVTPVVDTGKLSVPARRLPHMIDHIAVPVRDVTAAIGFYDTVLAALGAKRLMTFDDGAGYGLEQPDFWLEPQGTRAAQERHIAFSAPTRAAVHAFHDAAVTTGAEVLHTPQVWPEYHPTYYAAFVRDPDGNNIEAVCHLPE